MADLVLYTNPMSRGRIARWIMEEAGPAPRGDRGGFADYIARILERPAAKRAAGIDNALMEEARKDGA